MTTPDVLQVAQNDHPPFLELCRAHASALERLGCRVTTVFLEEPTSNQAPERSPDVIYLGVDPSRRHRRAAAAQIDALNHGRSYSLVVCHRYKAYRVALHLACLSATATVVAVAHEFGFFARWQRRWQARLFGRDVRFAGVSEGISQDLLISHPALGRAMQLPNPIDADALLSRLQSRTAARQALALPENAFIIGWVGRLHRKKQPVLAIEGLRQALPRLPESTQLIMIGDGDLYDDIIHARDKAGLAGHVVLAGQVDDAASYMSAFDFLLSSGGQESFGMVLLEAMIAGAIVLAANSPGPRSVVGDAGFYFSEGDPKALAERLVALAALPPSDAAAVRAAARERALTTFSIPAAMDRYRALLGRPMSDTD